MKLDGSVVRQLRLNHSNSVDLGYFVSKISFLDENNGPESVFTTSVEPSVLNLGIPLEF